jgi:hypothetical protein
MTWPVVLQASSLLVAIVSVGWATFVTLRKRAVSLAQLKIDLGLTAQRTPRNQA